MIKKIGKLLLEMGVIIGLIALFTQLPLALAEHIPTLPLGEADKYAQIPTPGDDLEAKQIIAQGLEAAVGYFKTLIGVFAIGFIIFSGARLVTSGGDEEAIKKASKGLGYSIAAFAIIALAEEAAVIVGFFKGDPGALKATGGIIGSPGEILSRVRLFDIQVEIVITFIKYMIGAVAVVMLLINGVRLVGGGGEEENTKKARNGVIYALVGLVLLTVGSTFITDVFYNIDKNVYSGLEGVDPQLDIPEGVAQIVGITNLIVSFIGPILVLLLVIGGVMYVTAAGEEENMNRAKRLILAALIGVIVVYGAFAIVSTIIAGSFSP
jgi:cytochrome bd-type quinol oxidase subunit 2